MEATEVVGIPPAGVPMAVAAGVVVRRPEVVRAGAASLGTANEETRGLVEAIAQLVEEIVWMEGRLIEVEAQRDGLRAVVNKIDEVVRGVELRRAGV
jgi:hypothetical protein